MIYNNRGVLEELYRLDARCRALSNRLVLLREEMREFDWMQFCRDHEEAYSWFNEDGTVRFTERGY